MQKTNIADTDDKKQNKIIVKEEKRIIWLDYARTLAIILVLLCHAIEFIYQMDKPEISVGVQLGRTMVFIIARLGVPIFLMISGTLLLSKKIETTEDICKFYKKSLVPLFITTELWIIIYNIVASILRNTPFSIKNLIFNMLFMLKVDFMNMWYMPVILGIYLAIPFLVILLKNIEWQALKIPLIISFICSFLVVNIGWILQVLMKEFYYPVTDLKFLGGMYGFYLVLGYLIGKKNVLKKVKTSHIVFFTLVCFMVSYAFVMWFYHQNIKFDIWYDLIWILFMSVGIFELISRVPWKEGKITNCISYISKISFAIFFLHIILQEILVKFFNRIAIINSLKVVILWILSFTISVGIIWIFSKIKIIKKYIFGIK